MNMVTVVGAGPAGSVAAKEIQERGWKTVLLEEHNIIGNPVNCTGIVSVTGTREARLQKQVEEVLMNKVRGAQIFSPNHEMIEIRKSGPVAYVVDRGGLDRVLAREAQETGVEIRLNTKMIDVRNETIFVDYKGRGEIIKSKLVVGADGVNSRIRKLAGIETTIKDYVHAYQVVAKGSFDPDFVQVYFGDYSRNFFAWIVPENEGSARIGLASTSGNIRKDFNFFINEKNIKGEFCDKCSSLIPVGNPLKKLVSENMMIVGDAAFQTKATTGGGILTGVNAARVLSESVHNYFKDGTPLQSYEKNCAGINKELELHWKIRKFMNSMNEEQLDKFFKKLIRANIGEFLSEYGDMDKPSRFIGKLAAKPAMWTTFPEAVKFFRS